MSEPRVIPAQEGAVGTITLNHPKANSYDLHFMKDLDAAIEAMDANDAVKVVVVKSGLDKFFSAGADIKAFQANTTDENMKMIRFAHKALRKMGDSPKVFIAAVGGHALGGGLEMALACDMIVMSRTARMGDGHLKFWQLPGGGGTQRLPRAIGFAAAKRLFYTYDLLDAEECRRVGLASEVYEPKDFMERTLELANRLMTTEPETVLALKRLMKAAAETPLTEGLGIEIDQVVSHAIGTEATAYRGLLRFSGRERA